ncbi:hypothetical protein Acsp06_37480 [Actinomycetospora sp. NBRC 106375]|uniref:LuxR C-terminal-related transcriptional regulator n=1 Tax=Actinomycetospora sp. NBRC 106375 TaxID=3032207 RepID=UPI0024A0AA2F|nr:LuxR C-terminal-related transcriptional regulator [Actinomycetospora sp. NBRC 106375]GLZ47563.1 hypothetical protein Acsp06_37480 [Actinomycetospora sp. NBRC 106375]
MVRIPASRTAVPSLPAWCVPRPALWQRLEAADAGQLVAVIAPAGSGKTVLLAEWAHHGDGTPTAWVGLDRDDADPDRFWSAVLAAVLGSGAVPADSPLHRLDDLVTAEDETVDALLDGLAALPTPIRLILDDVHVLATRTTGSRALARLVRHRPAGVRLVLAARSDPAVGLPRLRLDDGLRELRADGLRFSAEDTAALAAACGVLLDAEEAATLHRRTEGWAAGLRLAVLALRRDGGAEGTRAFLARFSGDERSVADYLGGEMLDGLPANDHELLGDLSVCRRLPDPLAVALSGHADIARRLAEIAHGLGMIERSRTGEPGEHHVHALLRSHLAADLARSRPARFRRQHAVAARWWAEHGEPAHALRHAERAEDPDLTAALLGRVGVPLLLHGELPAVRRALRGLGTPDTATTGGDPRLPLIAALAHLEAGEPAAASAQLRRARAVRAVRAVQPGADPELEALSAATELFGVAAGLPPAVDTGNRADPVDPVATADGLDTGTAAHAVAVPGDPATAGLLHLARGTALLAAAPPGDAAEARVELHRALARARTGGFAGLAAGAFAELALAAVVEGDPAGVAAAADAALDAGRRGPRPPRGGSVPSARTVALLAWADLLRGAPDRAADRCAEALADHGALAAADRYALHAVHGAAVGDLGRRGEGVAEARAARLALGDAALPGPVARALALLEHRDALLLGNLRAAGEVAAWLARRAGGGREGELMRAWSEAATGRWEAARTAALPLSRGTRAPATLAVEAALVETEAALRGNDAVRAGTALAAALDAARPRDLLRPFTLAGPRTRALLLERDAAGGAPFDARVATACAAVTTHAAPPLSERELIVLGLLPSLLDAPSMAQELVVSVNTVKTQIRSIYAKLGVSTRRGAVSRAQERGLLV